MASVAVGRKRRLFQSKIEDRDVHVKTTPGQDVEHFKTGKVMVNKLKHGLYSLAQSPVLRHGTINAAILTVGLTPTQSGPCVYTYGKDDTLVILTLYVDDILFTGNDEKNCEATGEGIDGSVCNDRYGRSQFHSRDESHPRL